MSNVKRPVSLADFANKLPPGVTADPAAGRYVFGSRLEDTLPYLVKPGAVAAIKPEDVVNTPVSVSAKVFTFDLSKPEEHASYQEVLDAIGAGWYKLVYVERKWDTDTKNMRVYIEVITRHRVISPKSEHDVLFDLLNGNKPNPIV